MTPPFPALHHLSTLSTMRIRPASPVSRSAVRTRQCPARALPNPERGSSASTLSDEEVECRLAALIDVLSKARPHHCGHHDARQQRACAVFVAAKISRSVACGGALCDARAASSAVRKDAKRRARDEPGTFPRGMPSI